MKGQLSEGVLPGILRDIYVGRRTGRLHFSRGDERYTVHFVKGHIVHAQSSVPQGHLGEIMLGEGLLDEGTLARATEGVRRTGKRLGQVLLEMGVLDKARLEDALAVQVREHLLRVFAWTEGFCSFEEVAVAGAAPGGLRLGTGQMVLEAARLARQREAIHLALGERDRVLILSTDPLLRFQRVTLTPADGYVLSRVDGVSTARQVLQMVPLPEEEAERSLFGLLCIGIVEYLPGETSPAARPADARRAEILDAFHNLTARDHFQVLEVARECSQAELVAAYYRQARRFHPDAHHDPELRDLRDQLDTVFQRISEAYETLRRPGLRQAYEASLDRAASATSPGIQVEVPRDPATDARNAAEVLRKAEERLRAGRHWEAVGLLEGLVQITTGLLRLQARLLLAEAHAKTPRGAKAMEAELATVVKENPGNVESRLRLALFYRDRGLRARAQDFARQVLELDPGHRGALDILNSVEPRPAGRGFLRRLLGGQSS